MSNLIQMKIGNNAVVLVEVDAQKATLEPISKKSTKEIPEVARLFDRITSDQIVNTCIGIIDGFNRLKKTELPPQKASAEFGLQFNLEGNAYVVKASTEASIKVTVEWDLGTNDIKTS